MRIILIGNYKPDRQESMLRFATMLSEGFKKRGIKTECWYPTVLCGLPFASTNNGLGKWLGYIDKWIIFPLWLRIQQLLLSKKEIHFHICDHSNAPYLKHLPKNKTSITCHDVIAIKAGLGYQDSYVSASRMGKILQKWILFRLCRATKLAAVSLFTLKELEALVKNIDSERKWCVIPNAFNAPFYRLQESATKPAIVKAGLSAEDSFILHVGSGHPRKNRKLLLDMTIALGTKWKGKICFAGEPLDTELLNYAKIKGLEDRIVSIVRPDHYTLLALYSSCEAFIFPSFSEGFGWPLIEAQACLAPVIASNIEPMPEISGSAAIHADPHDPQAFANALLLLTDDAIRQDLINRGFENVRRFNEGQMIDSYLNLYN